MRYRFLMRSRRTGVAFVASFASFVISACNLISGAGDLEVDPRVGLVPAVLPEGGSVVDATLPQVRDGGRDGSVVVDAADARVDAQVDGGTRIRAVTFEGGSQTGAFGFDTVSGQTNLVLGIQALGGAVSFRTDKESFGRITFSDKSELFTTFLVRFENLGLNTSTIVSFGGTPIFSPTIDVSVDEVNGFALLIGGDRVDTSATTPAEGVAYRIGVHIKAGAVGASVVQGFFAPKTGAFGAPIMESSARAVGPLLSISLGSIQGNSRAVYDDMIVDSASMPPP